MQNKIASIGKRVAAGLLDCILAVIFLMIFGIPFGDTYAGSGQYGGAGSHGDGVGIGVNGPSVILGVIIILVLFSYMEFKYGKTPGKFVCGIKVVNENAAAPLTLKQSIIRNLLRLIDGLFAYLVGFIIIVIDKNRQRLGDLVARTIVIDEKK